MQSASPTPRRGMEAFASRDFRLYQLARMVAVIGTEAQAVAVGWQVYSITHRAIDLGYTGLALFLPGLFFLLPAGHVADRFDRRHVILSCYTLQFLASTTLAVLAISGSRNVLAIYAVLFAIGTSRAFSGPASSALMPHLVQQEHFVNAITWNVAISKLANVVGPAVGGLLFTLPITHFFAGLRLEGAGIVFIFTGLTLLWFLVLVASLKVRLGRMEHRGISLKVIFAGFQYVRRAPILLGSFSLDLFVVLLGGATALLPIFANDILHQGPRGLGMLRAAPAAGALAMSLIMVRFPLRRYAGRKLFTCVSIFGTATVIFGFSRNLWLSLVSLAVLGAADMVSMVIRGSVQQLATPPAMRGRVSAVNSLFVNASNELGEFESGITAQWWGAVWATVIGGLGSLAVAGIWSVLYPKLRNADQLTPESLRVDITAKETASSE